MINQEDLELILLLQDIGIFYQRTGIEIPDNDQGAGLSYSRWSAAFAKEIGLSEEAQKIILYQHKPEMLKDDNPILGHILNKVNSFFSDNKTSGQVSLTSAFSKIRINENNVPRKHFLPVQKLDINEFQYPNEKDKINHNEEYQTLWKCFKKDIASVGRKQLPDTLFYLIKKYTLLMPSIKSEISLFDYIKIKTAITFCLYHYMECNSQKTINPEENTFILISGDISGIQHFIFRISSPAQAQEGMAKRLRGRSFYLNLLNDAVVTRIIDALELTEANILWCGGGNFQILAPDTEDIQRKIEEMKSKINDFLMNTFSCELFLRISVINTGLDDLKDLSKSKELIESQLSKAKKQKFIYKLNELFVDERKIPPKTCPVCDNPVIGNYQICKDCDEHENMGKRLARATSYLKAITIDENEGKGQFDAILFGVGYKLFTPDDKIEKTILELARNSKKIKIIKLNDTDFINDALLNKFSDNNLPVSFGFSFLANTVPVLDNKVLSFTQIAQLSKGANKLGILKMDVDNLGKIFRSGGNITTISTMSSMLDFFFSGILNKICEKYYIFSEKGICNNCRKEAKEIRITFPEEEIENEKTETVYKIENGKECKQCMSNKIPVIYINYAGGDDLLIIGPWDNIIELAKDISQEFIDFTCHNADIHISGGIFMSEKKFPIGRAVDHADKLLKKSKDGGKDRISVFDETVLWKSKDPIKGFNDIFDFTIELENHLDRKELSKGFLYSLLEMWKFNFKGFEKLSDSERCQRRTYIPLLKYKLARAIKDEKFRNDIDKKIQKVFPWIKIPVSWCSLRMR